MDRAVIRHLDATTDSAAVADLARRGADYIRLETGEDPGPDWAQEFFDDRPPGDGPYRCLYLGAERDGQLSGLMSMAFGWPEPTDAYIGLLLLDPADRGRGVGAEIVAAAKRIAREAGAARLLIAVLDANPRGRAFWERQGFRHIVTLPERSFGRARHVPHRMAMPL